MDGLSGVASGFAVASLAIQLAESVKKLYDFWESVKGAPAHFGALQTDLRLLSTVLERIDREGDLSDPCLRDVLKNCEGQVASLHKIVGDIVPGFKAESRRTRTWASLKAAFKKEKVCEFKYCLKDTMSTLHLALTMASHASYTAQNHALDKKLETLQLQQTQVRQMTQTVTTLSKMPDDLINHKSEIITAFHQMMSDSSNPVYRHGVEFGLQQVFKQISSVTMSEVDAQPTPLTRCSTTKHRRVSKRTRVDSRYQSSTTSTIFGTFHITSRTDALIPEGSDEDDDNVQYEHFTTIRVHPSQWLIKMGFQYHINAMITQTSQEWRPLFLKSYAVPDDAIIFGLCDKGDIEAVKKLFSARVATPWDTDSRGRTPLYKAAKNHDVELCEFLLKSGASKTAMALDDYRGYILSPLHALVKSTVLDSKRFINTFRLFTSEIDLSDRMCPIDLMMGYHSDAFNIGGGGVRETYAATVWALGAVSSNNMGIVRPGFWSEVIDSAIIYEGRYLNKLLDSILNLGPSIITGLNKSPCGTRSLCHSYVQFEQFSETVLQTFLSKGGSLHIISNYYGFRQPHTPTSLSINSSASFDKWATFIKENVENLEQFLEDEISAGVMTEEGWDINSLQILFNMDANPYKEFSCQWCTRSVYQVPSLYRSGVFRYPRWEKKLAGIKWAANPERLDDEIRNLGWRAKYDLLCSDCWRVSPEGLSPEEVERALERAREPRGRIEELDSEDSSTESDAESEELSSDYDSPFLLSLG